MRNALKGWKSSRAQIPRGARLASALASNRTKTTPLPHLEPPPMSPELQDELAAMYPNIFSDLSDPARPPACSLECGDGWFRLIERLCDSVQALVDQQDIGQHVAQHVKEKFGGLRFYWYASDDRVDAMTDLAEALSHFTCEQCGAPGVRNTNGWMSTRCDLHRDTRGGST